MTGPEKAHRLDTMGLSRLGRQAVLARTALVGLLCAALGLAIYAVVLAEGQPGPGSQAPTVPPALAHGAKAPSFSLARLGGGPPVTFSVPDDRPVVLQFFASWCTDCLVELKAFASAAHQLGERARFVGVDSNDPKPAEAEQLLARAGDRYPTGIDPYAQVAQRYLVADLPTTVFIDRAGHVVEVALGAQTAADVEHWVAVASGR